MYTVFIPSCLIQLRDLQTGQKNFAEEIVAAL